ncbi:MAG: preprotein translocase subunit SecG [Patescibacteria group bacterium]|nr:preprotein translocase subunit SecG [Patescibacteria group bacterium]MDD5566735.1 preprotein translocase subunit SecG [Patescibacteria group bacterium]
MQFYFNIALIVLSVLLTASVILQQRGSGLGGVFGGEGNVFETRRGVERYIFIFTIVVSVLFMGVAVANLLFT